MTTQNDKSTTETVTHVPDNEHVIIWEKQLNPEDSGNRERQQLTIKSAATLRQRLLMTVLPIVLIPLGIASTVGYLQTEAQVKAKSQAKLEELSLLTGEASYLFLQNEIQVLNLVEHEPLLLEALKLANQQVAKDGLAQQSNRALEQKFSGNKLLQPNAELNAYLRRVVLNASLAEAFVTDLNGLNVGYSSPTSDFVQRDERWWQFASLEGLFVSEPEFDDSAQANVIAIAKQIKDIEGNPRGVIKIGLPASNLEKAVNALVSPNLTDSELVQVVDPRLPENHVIDTIAASNEETEAQNLRGGAQILTAAKILVDSLDTDSGKLELTDIKLRNLQGLRDLTLVEKDLEGLQTTLASFAYGDYYFKISIIPDTQLVAISSQSISDASALARNQLLLFAGVGLLLAGVGTAALFWLANTLANPLSALTRTAGQAAEGDLEVQATVSGTHETQTLARTFNALVATVKNLLNQQKAATQAQQAARDQLEQDIYQLIDEVGGAMDGDLTVRAGLSSMEMSTVADLINAIIDSLSDVAGQVKTSSGQVRTALDANGQTIQTLAEEALQETAQARSTLDSIEQMSTSIAGVATNASQAAALSDEAYTSVQDGSEAMDETVDSILNLRNTVGETAKKIKRLGESSQKISQVVSLIEEIALKTNLLAINASVEASRAGEQGQGFTVVAEQVGALAEQSAAATKEIAQIVAEIQAETQDVTEAMEIGTNQVVHSTRLVEATKDKLAQVLHRSQDINMLMRSISAETVSQSETSKAVTSLMQRLAELAELRSHASTQMAQSMQETATIAQQLETAVAQFKIPEDAAQA